MTAKSQLPTPINLVIGLGNYEDKYHLTRHNVGFLLVDFLAGQAGKSWQLQKSRQVTLIKVNSRLTLIKPISYMNTSGPAIKKYLIKTPSQTDNLLVVHDDLDIGFGSWKLSFGKGPKQHNGLISVEQALGTKKFWRLRIGIDNRSSLGYKIDGSNYVLSRFTKSELDILENQIFPEAMLKLGLSIDNKGKLEL